MMTWSVDAVCCKIVMEYFQSETLRKVIFYPSTKRNYLNEEKKKQVLNRSVQQ